VLPDKRGDKKLRKTLVYLILLLVSINIISMEFEYYPAQDMKVEKDTPIYVRFSEPMDPEYINRFTFVLNDGVSDLRGKVIYKEAEQTAHFIPLNYLEPGNTYKAMIMKGIKTRSGKVIEKDIVWSFRVMEDSTVITTLEDMRAKVPEFRKETEKELEIISLEPADKSVIKKTVPITVKFSAPLDEATVNKYTFMVKNQKRKWPGKLEVKDNAIVFYPYEPFSLDSQYSILITNFIKDIYGISFNTTHEFTFRTATVNEDEPPVVVNNYPAHNDFNVSPGSNIVVEFSKNMDPSTLNRFNVILSDGVKNVWGNIDYNEKDNILTFDPEYNLPINTKCTFKIRKNVRDIDGQFMPQDFEITFSTGAEVEVLIHEGTGEVDRIEKEKKDDEIMYTERYRFSTDELFFIKDHFPKDRDTMIDIDTKIKIDFSHAARVHDVNAFNFTVSDGVKNIWGDVFYDEESFVAYFSPRQKLRHNTLYYIRVSKSIKDIYGQELDRYYEWTFVTEPLPDKVPPEIVEVYPGDKETKLDPDVVVRVKFNEQIRVESLNKFTVRLTDGVDYIKCDITYDIEKNIAFIQPFDKLKQRGFYRLILSQGISDIAGNFMKEEVSTTFWTGEPPDKTPPQILAISPIENAPVYTTKPLVSITFNEPMDTRSLTPFNFGLLKGEEPVKGVVEYSPITFKAIYRPLENLKFGQIYRVFLTNRIKDRNGNNFPKNILWEFIVSHKEKTLPEVIATFPYQEKLNFPRDEELFIQFNKDMNPASLNRFTVKLRDMNMRRVDFKFAYDDEKRELVLTPFKNLEFNQKYMLTINKYVQDTEGKNMENNYTLVFYTEGRGHVEDNE